MMERGRCQQGRDGGHTGVDAPVGQDQDIGAVADGFQRIDAE